MYQKQISQNPLYKRKEQRKNRRRESHTKIRQSKIILEQHHQTMMMMGESGNLSISVPPWPYSPNLPVSGISASATSPTGEPQSPYSLEEVALAAAAFQRYFPNSPTDAFDDSDESDLADPPVDAYSCDEFRMYEFKVRRCARGRSHDWTECPFAHPGEKARRRDPRKYHYSGTACPDFRKGQCKRGDSCEFAHGVFECWLHPARYRTQPCKDGTACRRRVCFFAHTPEQLRVLPQEKSPRAAGSGVANQPESYDGSPQRRQHALDMYVSKCLMSSSPTSTLLSPPKSPPSESPPMSPVDGTGSLAMRRGSFPVGSPVGDVLASLRQLRLGKVKSMPSSWGVQVGGCTGTPKGTGTSGFRTGFCSLPSTPTIGGNGNGVVNPELGLIAEEPAERVESGWALRAKLFEKLSMDEVAPSFVSVQSPDVDWISDLVN
ncbi:Zinc finger CCCH domain-containing protein 2 [Rhynchospora pubera]|uniref:Zinc finger CCCH domain-containing protein 2 n=1 Tax=Rhynchospora pubera TaxID=906938 RepID=A0AAV8DNH3_9POAL|nr:Zinc finger CCCH domain-containing protein 2 [Rhynchospora pubera]